jgi:hypothetical protein
MVPAGHYREAHNESGQVWILEFEKKYVPRLGEGAVQSAYACVSGMETPYHSP